MRERLHSDEKQSKLYDEIEIQTLVSTYMFPDRYSEESLELKEAIVKCNRKDVFRTTLIQSYINEDWQNFAQRYARIELVLYLCFVGLIMLQFWQTSLDEAVNSSKPSFLSAMIPILSVTLLVVNILKEIFQMINEGKGYFIDEELSIQFENVGDLIAYGLISVCQVYYFGTGRIINGYFFPDYESFFEDFLLLAILALHLNLILQHMIALKITRRYVIMIIQTMRDTYKFYVILLCFVISYFLFLMLN